MKTLNTFGLPISIDEKTNEFKFDSDVLIEKSSSKETNKMKGLLYCEKDIDDNHSINYTFYNNVMKKSDAHLYNNRHYSNGITVLMPGLVNGECRKNSGHFHEVSEGHMLPFPETYEILCGEAVFMIQICKDFHNLENGLKVDSVKAVFMKAGDKIVVPPYCAHVAINIGDDIMAFGNLAAICNLNYEPIKVMHGLCYYVLKVNNKVVFVPNNRYNNIPLLKVTEAKENVNLGLLKNKSLYEMYTANPDAYAYLSEPEKYIDEISKSLM